MVSTPDCACAGLCFFFVGIFYALCIHSITEGDGFFAILCGVIGILLFMLGSVQFMESENRKEKFVVEGE